MAGKTLRFFNLTGGLNTIQDLFTMNSGSNRTETPDMVNMEYFKLGGLKTMEGNIQIGQTIKDSTNQFPIKITSGFEYIKDNNIEAIITSFDNRGFIYNYITKQWDDLQLGFVGTSARHSICSFNNGVIITDGTQYAYYEKDRKDLLGKVNGTINTNVLTSSDINFENIEELKLSLAKKPTILVGSTTYHVEEIVSSTEIKVTETIQSTITDADTYFTQEVIPFKPTLTNTTDNVTFTPVEIKGLALNSYKGRLWIGGEDNNLYYSELGLYYGFDIKGDAGAFGNFNEDRSSFTALGIWSEYLIAHKVNGSYLVDANNSDTSNWSVKPYSEMTCLSQQSFISNDIGYYLYDRKNNGIYPLLSRSIYNTTYMGKELSLKINNSFEYLDKSKLSEIYITYQPKKQYLCFYMNFVDGNGYSNKCYIYDNLTKSWLYRELPQNVTCAFQIDNEVYVGTQDGEILKEFQGSTFNGNPINFYWLSPSYVWSGGTNKATTKEFRVKLENETSNNFYIESIIDNKRTSKRKRRVTNNKDNGINLVWDIGYNLEDRTYKEPIEQDGYKWLGSDNKTYYSIGNAITEENVSMYYTNDPINGLTDFAGYNNTITKRQDGTEYNYNAITYTTKTVYKWQDNNKEFKCYVNSNNPNIKAWLNPDSDKTKAQVNIKVTEKNVIKYQGFKFLDIPKGIAGSDWIMRTTPAIYNQIIDYQAARKSVVFSSKTFDILLKTNQGWLKKVDNKFFIGVATNTISSSPGGRMNFVAAVIADNGAGIGTGGATALQKLDEYNTYTTVQEEVWNGRTDSVDSITKDVTTYSETSIVIDGVTYNRYTEGDYGTPTSPLVYTSTNYAPGQKIYSDKELQNVLGTITAVGEDNASITVDNTTYYFVIKEVTQTPSYWLDIPITYTLVESIKVLEDYQYPDEMPINTLTDTVWDNNLWVNVGYETKRMILSDQYFETIQYRFYGNSLEDNLCIAGFEVDGIQLTEVPN